MGTLPFAYFRGCIVPHEQAQVSIACNSLQYGTTCFSGIRGYRWHTGVYKMLRPRDHLERLLQGGKILGMDVNVSPEEFESILRELTQRNRPDGDFYIRPFLFTPDEILAPRPRGLRFELAVYMTSMGRLFDPMKGARLMISSWRKFPDAALPTKAKAGGCYVNSFLASGEAERAGYDEALMMDCQGNIVEASVANLLVVRRGIIYSPPFGAAMLDGITLRTALECLTDAGIPVQFQTIDRSMVYGADEVILLGTAAQVSFAESVDGRKMGVQGPGPITSLLREHAHKILEGVHPKSGEWVLCI